MGFKPLAVTDIPCDNLQGVTTVQLAEMLHGVFNVDMNPWPELKPETKTIYYKMAAQLIRDWPKA
jgi:hypothetical protein